MAATTPLYSIHINQYRHGKTICNLLNMDSGPCTVKVHGIEICLGMDYGIPMVFGFDNSQPRDLENKIQLFRTLHIESTCLVGLTTLEKDSIAQVVDELKGEYVNVSYFTPLIKFESIFFCQNVFKKLTGEELSHWALLYAGISTKQQVDDERGSYVKQSLKSAGKWLEKVRSLYLEELKRRERALHRRPNNKSKEKLLKEWKPVELVLQNTHQAICLIELSLKRIQEYTINIEEEKRLDLLSLLKDCSIMLRHFIAGVLDANAVHSVTAWEELVNSNIHNRKTFFLEQKIREEIWSSLYFLQGFYSMVD